MITLDYLAGTVHTNCVDDVKRLFDRYVDAWELTQGALGYRQCWRGNGIQVYFDGMSTMGVHFEASGSGCASIFTSAAFEGWGAEVKRLLAAEVQLTRGDLAFDEVGGAFTVDDLRGMVERGEYTSRWQDYQPTAKYSRGRQIMNGFYVGASSSNSTLCVYDKGLEREAKGKPCGHPWVRLELRLKGAKAVALGKWIVNNQGIDGAQELLAAYIEFKVPSEDSNKARWEVAPLWANFLGTCNKTKLFVAEVVRSLAEKFNQAMKQAAPSLAVLYDACSQAWPTVDWFNALIEGGRSQWKQKHKNELARLIASAVQPELAGAY